MKEEIKKRLLATNPIAPPASPPSDPEQQATKRVKEDGDFNSEVLKKCQVSCLLALALAGKLKKDDDAERMNAATAAAATDRNPLFSFPFTHSSHANSSQQEPHQTDSDILQEASASVGINSPQQDKEQIPSSPGSMGPPPPRPPGSMNRLHPLSPGGSSCTKSTVIVASASTTNVPGLGVDNSKNKPSQQMPASTSATPENLNKTLGASAFSPPKTDSNSINGNRNKPSTLHDQIPTGLSAEPFVVLSSLLSNIQQQFRAIEASGQLRDTEIVKLATAHISIKHIIHAMVEEWRHVVVMMQGAVREHAAEIKNHTDSIHSLELRLFDTVNQTSKDRSEIQRLTRQVESMSKSMAVLARRVEEQDEARRRFEQPIRSPLMTQQQQAQEEITDNMNIYAGVPTQGDDKVEIDEESVRVIAEKA